jgi:nitroreductase
MFADQDVSQNDVLMRLNAANQAPSAHNQQSWRFIVLRADKKAEFVNLITNNSSKFPRPSSALLRMAARSIAGAPLVIAVINTGELIKRGPSLFEVDKESARDFFRIMEIQSSAVAMENMLIAATSIGLSWSFPRMWLKIRNTAVFALFIALQFMCSLFEPKDHSVAFDLPTPGMNKIYADGITFMQGCNDSLAIFEEKPTMSVTFTYNYWLDTNEVTQRDFYTITGKRPVSDTSKFGVGADFPVYNVSWFDAVLFCNAKSRRSGFDTVYS